MRDLLVVATEYTVTVIDMLALLVIVAGTLEALLAGMAAMFGRPGDGQRRRDIWVRYGRWLIGGLTFQLAADIIETSITDDWASIGRIAPIAVIRTFLNYFLEKDLGEVRLRQRGGEIA